ncbi:hypothetical protein LINPERPRIM_LOCUS15891 [Linum perenne]
MEAYSRNLGICSITRAELRAVVTGLQLLEILGFRKIHLHMDSKAAMAAIGSEMDDDARHRMTIKGIHELLGREYEAYTSLVFREGNRVSDLLAHHGHNFDFRTFVNCVYPPGIDRYLD